jgi:hypothetical protein
VKAHLLDSDDPLTAGRDYAALCGQKVSKAEFVWFLVSGTYDIAVLSSLVCCPKCRCVAIGKRYLYGLIDGEQAKHAEQC